MNMRQLLVLLPVLALTGCDKIAFAVQNRGGETERVRLIYAATSECKTEGWTTLTPGMSVASRCPVSELQAIEVENGGCPERIAGPALAGHIVRSSNGTVIII